MKTNVEHPTSNVQRRTPKADAYFLPYQVAWIRDPARLKIVEKSRQIGFSYADSYDSVRKAAAKDGSLVGDLYADRPMCVAPRNR